MTTDDDESSGYPDPREALRPSNGKVANVYCAVKYTAWHGIALILALIVLAGQGMKYAWRGFIEPWGYAAAKLCSAWFDGLCERFPSISSFSWVGAALMGFGRGIQSGVLLVWHTGCHVAGRIHEGLVYSGEMLMSGRSGTVVEGVFLVLFSPAAFVLLACDEIDQRTGVFTGLYNIVLFVILTAADTLIGFGKQTGSCTSDALDRAGEGLSEKASEMKERPGTRRIYGQCPVSFDQPPRWFENLFEEDEPDPVVTKGSEDEPWTEDEINDFLGDDAEVSIDERVEPSDETNSTNGIGN